MGCGASSAATAHAARKPCKFAQTCVKTQDISHTASFSHPGDSDWVSRASCIFGDDCPSKAVQEHRLKIAHPGDADYLGPRKACDAGWNCTITDVVHLRRFSHASAPAKSGGQQSKRIACKFGLRCFRRAGEHIDLLAHPGDNDYRMGRVVFEDGASPMFETLRQLFDFCDPLEHGNYTSKDTLGEALNLLKPYCETSGTWPSADAAWQELEGDSQTFVDFAKFAAYARRRGTKLPMGVELAAPGGSTKTAMTCGFVFPDGKRCECKDFAAADATGRSTDVGVAASKVQFCSCGHKRSMHTVPADPSSDAPVPAYWKSAQDVVMVELDAGRRARFQELFDHTHKAKDNWTRDRGCVLHGVNNCPPSNPSCCFDNRAPVPTGYRVMGVVRNMNKELWGYYALNRGAVTAECTERDGSGAFKPIVDVASVDVLLEDSPAVDGCNEWYLFHGSSEVNCLSIMRTNYRVSLAGTGATWKEGDDAKGTPLYGFGLYFAERVTKADEYSEMLQADHPFAGCHTVLVNRVVGGRAQYCDSNEIDPKLLQKNVIAGAFHSVFGDRVAKLKKPYREVVIYNASQCYPEYLVYYKRLYG
eukprot:TRINITY_DN31090_c0_g1_i1.p1 TRINITY_DN31090_c0_g1~~TRINITY_DN31090_c0_g1_i1.p1  ORF type:complete len:589 (+),score=90.51 TRINITY_DN31090_c0_g1_i1:121-1887(+)